MRRFRVATESDADLVLNMMRSYYTEDGYPFREERAREALLALIRDPSLGRLWVAELEGRCVGYFAVTFGFSLEYEGRDAFLDELFVAAEARRQALGREALEIAQEYCRETGVKALHLEVESHRQAAADLYEGFGFASSDRRLMTLRIENEGG